MLYVFKALACRSKTSTTTTTAVVPITDDCYTMQTSWSKVNEWTSARLLHKFDQWPAHPVFDSWLPTTGVRAYYMPENLTKTPKIRWPAVQICQK